MDAFADHFPVVNVGSSVAEEGHGRGVFHPAKGALPELSGFRLATDVLDHRGVFFPHDGVDMDKGLKRGLAAEGRIRGLELRHLLSEEVVGKAHLVAAELPLQDQGGDCTDGFISGPVPGQDSERGGTLNCLHRESEVGNIT